MSQQKPENTDATPTDAAPTTPETTPSADATPEVTAPGATADAAPATGAAPAADATPAPDAAPAAPQAPAPAVVVEEVAVVEEVVVTTTTTDGPGLLARLGAEAFGTFLVVLAGVGIWLYSGFSGTQTTLTVALGFGVATLAAVATLGHVSGGHVNPAVTLGAVLAGRTRARDLLPYWLAQVAGGALAAAVLFLTVPAALPALLSQTGEASVRSFVGATANGFAENSPLSRLSTGSAEFGLVPALLVEVVLTAVLVGVVLAATDRRTPRGHAPYAIGLTYAVLLLVALPVTNAGLNPARSTAVAIFSEGWALEQLWLFWVAPLVGAAVAALVYRAFASEPLEIDELDEDDDLEDAVAR
ncbi:aquaporin [Cellulomonas sp. SLBN-39]|uniref:aquaporin n=1 Tax=Cellulomonas sp. SLBN-39 TaxID=2768446 RepID=UPI0011536998|nr:aquaporin [Cellulomonas sp. SLBN-39]TQL03473.1 aquaporin Z [Cellulomonas sp. SLBN-39]